MEEELNLEKQILDELADVIGIDKSVIIDYAKYCALKTTGGIVDLGNYNFMIKTPKNYLDQSKITETLTKILLHYFKDLKIYELTQKDLRHLQDIDASLIVIDAVNNVNLMVSTMDILQEYIYANTDKIFILVYSEQEDAFKQNRNIASVFMDYFSWSIEVGEATPDEKSKYIKDKLHKNHITVAKNCDFVQKLMMEEMATIDKQLLYLTVKSKVTNIETITDDFLQLVNRPQYISAPKLKEKSAMQELDEMIGLDNVNQQIKQIVNYVKVNKSRGQMPKLHMCFLGNPGTAKSTVAKLVSRIFLEEGILNGNFVEATRSNLVAGYIGQSALKTRDVLNKARDGVLFLDEVYSLYSDSPRDFSHEVVAELVKFMEDENICVIMAGYPLPVEEFLKSNEGLESRIQFKLNFPDYSAEELYLIFKKMLKENNYKIDKGIKQLLLEHFKKAKNQENFGNGRYVRNIFDKLRFEQADRITSTKDADKDLITKDDLRKVLSRLEEQQPEPKRMIGFTMT